MKKHNVIRIGGLFLLLVLSGCTGTAEVSAPTAASAPVVTAVTVIETQTPAPAAEALQELLSEEADEGEERILARCVSITEELPYSADLDGDGADETVFLTVYTKPEDDYPRWAVVLTKDGRQTRSETWIPCDTWYDLWVGDLDEDGGYEIFFHGDTASDDYLIYAFRADLTPILFEPDERLFRYGKTDPSDTMDARVDGFEDGHLVVRGPVNMLGTHDGVRNYAIGEDGVIGPMSTVWDFDDEDRSLTVTKALTAYKAGIRRDPGEAFTLEPGDRIYPLASDGHSRFWFRTGKGAGGVLLLTPDEDAAWLIDGVPEAEFFDFLPYAG